MRGRAQLWGSGAGAALPAGGSVRAEGAAPLGVGRAIASRAELTVRAGGLERRIREAVGLLAAGEGAELDAAQMAACASALAGLIAGGEPRPLGDAPGPTAAPLPRRGLERFRPGGASHPRTRRGRRACAVPRGSFRCCAAPLCARPATLARGAGAAADGPVWRRAADRRRISDPVFKQARPPPAPGARVARPRGAADAARAFVRDSFVRSARSLRSSGCRATRFRPRGSQPSCAAGGARAGWWSASKQISRSYE